MDLGGDDDPRGLVEEDGVDEPSGRAMHGHLEEATPARMKAADECFDDRCLVPVADARPRTRVQPDREIGAERIRDRGQDLGARLGLAELDRA